MPKTAGTLHHVELVDRIYERVKQMIFDRELLPGQKLVQEKLAEQLGISRSPLLKALQRLESELLVEKLPRRGIYVKQLSRQEILDVFACRAVLEGLSARLLAARISEQQITALQRLFKSFTGQEVIDDRNYAIADRQFHSKIMEWSGNTVIPRLEMLSNIHLQAYQVGLLRPPLETLQEHFDIINAMKNGREFQSEQLMRSHIEKSMEALALEGH